MTEQKKQATEATEAKRGGPEEGASSAAQRLGIEHDTAAARTWMLAVASTDRDAAQIGENVAAGIFGDKVSLLDFNTDDLARFRALIPYVRLEPRPEIESALSIAGSAAQGKVQLFPGDADFFERVHIHAASASEAQAILRDTMRKTALRAMAQPDIVLLETHLGSYPEPVIERGKKKKPGASIQWLPADVVKGAITVELPGGASRTFQWDEVDVGNGWIYLYWIVAERAEKRIAIASNVVDVTWEDPSGTITSFDGAVDPLVQEVYLEASALPLVQKLSKLVAPGAREAYQAIMKEQVYHYTKVTPSFGKAAKRLYNLLRASDELEAAAYVRELFDEPAARLYQITGLLEAADAALDQASGIDRDTVMRQLDLVAETIDYATDGKEESTLLASVERLRSAALEEGRQGASWASVLANVRAECSALVNDFFRSRLMGYEPVRAAIEAIGSSDLDD
jgi:hypothetical protein